jgi:hypothetical protein
MSTPSIPKKEKVTPLLLELLVVLLLSAFKTDSETEQFILV